ncbi:extracellular solute-binding protein [Streptacidiphilus sp. PB12-B1b]|uniref:extracellular solute-binding protein n=1 Tax=Streptacidiphilus sp. PB12-B1b TaxID=2705012 RepID=UPI0015FBA408|nr:extracellular solute-binding protein [Streptacidiphilus sp. PB12-B1b]QMU79209.1 extracellular solute-binding protein [Streptacidiphilus sp. PB12-B1b]
MNRRLLVALGTAATLAAVTACGSGSGGGAAHGYAGQTLTVWLMQGDAPASWQAAVTAQFEAAYPGARLNVVQQSWSGIQERLSEALSALTPPDVVDIGNTQTSYYASIGGLLNLGPYRKQLGGADWSSAMNASTLVGGVQYAAPWFAGLRVVMYNKALWAKARLSPPSTQAQWISDLRVLQDTPGVSSALWLPGQDWYAFDGFLQQAGAGIIARRGNRWVGNLDSPAGLNAATLFRLLQAFGKAPKDNDEAHPVQADEFAKGHVASMIALGYEAGTVLQASPGMADDIGWFPIPGPDKGVPAKTFLGGSNLAVAQNTTDRTLALGFVRIALDAANESAFAKASGFLPNKAGLYPALRGNAYGEAESLAAPYAGYTPLVPDWGDVEAGTNPITTDFLTPVLEGENQAQAADKADAEITARLGGG